jgi:hypothetical protein
MTCVTPARRGGILVTEQTFDDDAPSAQPIGPLRRDGIDTRSARSRPGTASGIESAIEPHTEWVPVELLAVGDSPRRAGEDPEHTRALADLDAPLPPVLVHRASMRVVDGLHRLRAAILRGQHSIEVRFFDGSPTEAFVRAVHTNVTHGLPLTLADRKAAAARILAWYPQWSDRYIATVSGLATRTVAALRAGVGAQAAERLGRDGRLRPIDTSQRRLLAGEIIARNPAASLREIARASGISPGTARDVRMRVLRGEHPVPANQRGGAAPAGREKAEVPLRHDRIARPHVTAPVTEHPSAILRQLHNDPSLRLSEAGRTLLRWLAPRAAGTRDWAKVVNVVPPHSLYTVARLARACAEDWQRLAESLEEQGYSSA